MRHAAVPTGWDHIFRSPVVWLEAGFLDMGTMPVIIKVLHR